MEKRELKEEELKKKEIEEESEGIIVR